MKVPLITPCGHIFGHRCFEKWRQTCEQNDQKVSCPACRFDLHFNCGHLITPLFAFDLEIPPKIRKEEVPDTLDSYIESSQHAEEISLLISLHEDGYRTPDG